MFFSGLEGGMTRQFRKIDGTQKNLSLIVDSYIATGAWHERKSIASEIFRKNEEHNFKGVSAFFFCPEYVCGLLGVYPFYLNF